MGEIKATSGGAISMWIDGQLVRVNGQPVRVEFSTHDSAETISAALRREIDRAVTARGPATVAKEG